MGMTPQSYFALFVKKNLEDFESNPDCLRRAFNSAISTAHMVDNYFNYYKDRDANKVQNRTHINEFRRLLSSRSPYFNDIQSVANVYKHLYQGDRSNYDWVTVNSGGAVYLKDTDVSFLVGGEWGDSDDDFILHQEQHMAVNKSGHIVYHNVKTDQEIPLINALREVVAIWEQIIS